MLNFNPYLDEKCIIEYFKVIKWDDPETLKRFGRSREDFKLLQAELFNYLNTARRLEILGKDNYAYLNNSFNALVDQFSSSAAISLLLHEMLLECIIGTKNALP